MKTKILCLGNEFIKEDKLAKKVGEELSIQMKDLDFISIKDSFQIIDLLKYNENLILIDVVKNLKEIRKIKVEDLSLNTISNSHDIDAAFFIKLLGEQKNINIIGIPMEGDLKLIMKKVKKMIEDLI